ncbi:MAG: ABC transporter substrate-binding protein [Bacillota bacterium]
MSLLRRASVVALVGVLCLGMVGLSGCSGASKSKVLKIGVVGPETGGSAQLGQAQHRAVQLACDEINAANAAGGWKLEAYFEDDEGNPTKSASATNKLIQETKVNAVIAAINSSCTLADMVHTERAGIPQITAGSTGASITELGNKWIFRTAVNDELQANALVEYAVKTLGLKKASTLTAADDYGQSGAKLLKAAAEKAGLELVVTATYNGGDKDFKPQLLSMKEKETEAIFLWGIYTEAALIAKQARTLDINCQLFGASGMAAAKLMELGEGAVEGMLLTQSFLPDSPDAKVKDFVAKYKQKYNENPIPHGAQAYDSVYILADSVKRANSNAPQALKDAIMKTSGLQLVTGSPKFIEKGDDVGKRVLITKIDKGTFVLVESIMSGN